MDSHVKIAYEINFSDLFTQTIRRLKQFLSESRICDYVEMIFDADGDLTSLNNIKVRLINPTAKQ